MGEDPVRSDLRRVRVQVTGVVQGVGFRPYLHRMAVSLGLAGEVGNDQTGVIAELEGPRTAVDELLRRLPREAPPLAAVETVAVTEMAVRGGTGFRIAPSHTGEGREVLVPPDTAPCASCLAEVDDPIDRRFRYALTNCTQCGPRFTIVVDVPYDRARTTMAAFALCPDCEREYHDPTDRRFHAEPVCCPRCGPRLRLVPSGPGAIGDVAGPGPPTGDPIADAARLLATGRIVAVKGVGGYHLAVDATDGEAVARLRRRKHREDKPFAVLVPDRDTAHRLGVVTAEALAALTCPAAPIVLVPRRPGAAVADPVAPGNRWLGLMLPPSPLHHLLARQLGGPLVLTSGNVSDEPIAHDDHDARRRLGPIADAFLTHDRTIHTRADDSVVRAVAGRVVPVRRSRGYAPSPLRVPWPFTRPVLAVGAQLKNTFCLGKGYRAFVSHHIGDLENLETLRAFESGIEHYQRLFDVDPAVVAHDLHPDYLSTAHALSLDHLEAVGVQHHHAHVASCLADNGEAGPVIGVAFDGLGYGTDGGLWGGEVLVADLVGFERVAHLEAVPMPGGDAATRQPWRMAAAHLVAAFGDTLPAGLSVADRHRDRWDPLLEMCRSGFLSPPTTSMGRLFDAVAAIAGVRDEITYEGQAAVELEQRAEPGRHGAYPIGLGSGDPIAVRGSDAVRAVVADLAEGVPVGVVAARFHDGIAACVVEMCQEVRRRHGLSAVALSGGVFQNARLIERVVPDLSAAGFRVLTHRQVPPNDGGISLGQAVVVAALDRRSGTPWLGRARPPGPET